LLYERSIRDLITTLRRIAREDGDSVLKIINYALCMYIDTRQQQLDSDEATRKWFEKHPELAE